MIKEKGFGCVNVEKINLVLYILQDHKGNCKKTYETKCIRKFFFCITFFKK